MDFRNQKHKTNTQELGHIGLALFRCALLIFNYYMFIKFQVHQAGSEVIFLVR